MSILFKVHLNYSCTVATVGSRWIRVLDLSKSSRFKICKFVVWEGNQHEDPSCTALCRKTIAVLPALYKIFYHPNKENSTWVSHLSKQKVCWWASFLLTILIVFNDELQIILLVFTRRKLQTLGDQVIRVALYITTVMFVIPAPCIYYRQVRNMLTGK